MCPTVGEMRRFPRTTGHVKTCPGFLVMTEIFTPWPQLLFEAYRSTCVNLAAPQLRTVQATATLALVEAWHQ